MALGVSFYPSSAMYTLASGPDPKPWIGSIHVQIDDVWGIVWL